MLAIDTGSKATRLRPTRSASSVRASTELRAVPTPIAATAPIALPRNPMKVASRLNIAKTRPLPMPIAFISPISRVRSCTDMNSVFTMPNAAASSAMIANAFKTSTMPSMTLVTVPRVSATVVPV